MGRRLRNLLLLTVVISNLLLGVHVATHYSAGSVECELCAAYSDPSHAIPASDVAAPLDVGHAPLPVMVETCLRQSTRLTTCPRGPPALT
jgi:hypothetical protein